MNKMIIGMVHLKALPTAPNNKYSVKEIINFALEDLRELEKGGVEYAIIENFFDTPYSNNPDLETIVAMAYIIGYIKDKTAIKLGVNIHATSGPEEMILASICDLDFIRSETFVDIRVNQSGIMNSMCSQLTRKKKQLNSKVKIFADVNVKESLPFIYKDIEISVNDAINSGTDAIILTGLETGKSPSVDDVKKVKELCGSVPLLIGSGVNKKNISDYLEYAQGVIVGSSLKKDGLLDNNVDSKKVKELINSI